MADVNLAELVKDGVAGLIRRFEELLGVDTEPMCMALVLAASCLEAELKCRLPLERPDYVQNTRSLIEGLADQMTKKILASRGAAGIISNIEGPEGPPNCS